MQILTHRGLDPAKKPYFSESSKDAFTDQLNRGFGLEFDIQFISPTKTVIVHDLKYADREDLVDLPELLSLIKNSKAQLSALHLKHNWQTKDYLDKLLEELKNFDVNRLIIFDLKIDAAKYIKQKNPNLNLAPSVSHSYDIERYNNAVGGTLITIDEAIENKDLFSWVWLDEWDRSLPNSGEKTLYNKENFELLRKNDFKIALVTPELHATSPGLLGGESHQDARDTETLARRLKEIIELGPDAVCTDWPDLFKNMGGRSY